LDKKLENSIQGSNYIVTMTFEKNLKKTVFFYKQYLFHQFFLHSVIK